MSLNFLIVCYFIGSIPFAYIVVKMAKGVDIREYGSGNVGATNAGRILGKWGFITVFLLDMLKGFLPIFFLMTYFHTAVSLIIGAALALIIGHMYTAFLNFQGGKGVATAVGIYLAISPISLIIAAVAFAVTIYFSKMVSLSSIVAAVVLAIAVFFTNLDMQIKILTIALAGFVIYKHKDNIKRILDGTESKIGEKSE
jgi:glycerol-3-phosphate acyltransferase PlsY